MGKRLARYVIRIANKLRAKPHFVAMVFYTPTKGKPAMTITKSQKTALYGQRSCTVCTNQCEQADGQTSFCGDGLVDAQNGEACDDQNDDETDGCLSNCSRGTLCGDGVLDANEECDGDDDTVYCTDECICDVIVGEGNYQEPCVRASDCSTGLCVENPLASGNAFCTPLCENNGGCPGLDQCVSVGAPSPDICLQRSLGYEPGDIFSICMPNDTGYPCGGLGTDCPISGVCYSPMNPAPFDVSVRLRGSL